MKVETNPVKTNIEITSGQSNVRFDVREQTTEVMGLKSNVTGPSVEWELEAKEDKVNKTQTIGPESTSVQYPSAQAVYEALQNIPGGEQVQSDWTQTDDTQVDFIKHKPNLATVATSGSYTDLSDKPTIPVVPTNVSAFNNDAGYITLSDVPAQSQADWNQTDNTQVDYIKNKPSIPSAQVNSDWNAVSGVSQILNKPSLATVATSGSYNDLSGQPTIPVVATAITSGDTGYVTGDMAYQYIQSLDGSNLGEPDLTFLCINDQNRNGVTVSICRPCDYIDWGDGSPIEVGANGTSHTYANFVSGVKWKIRFWGLNTQVLGTYNIGVFNESDIIRRYLVQSAKIGDSLINIPHSLFYYCQAMNSVILPQNVQGIGQNAFSGCTKLRGITIPDGCQFIAGVNYQFGNEFSGCTSLKRIDLSGLGSIGSAVSWGTSFSNDTALEEVIIGPSVTAITGRCFMGCSSLKSVKVNRAVPPTLYNVEVFDGCPATMTIGVPWSADHSILQAYQTASNWSTYASQMYEMGSNVTTNLAQGAY